LGGTETLIIGTFRIAVGLSGPCYQHVTTLPGFGDVELWEIYQKGQVLSYKEPQLITGFAVSCCLGSDLEPEAVRVENQQEEGDNRSDGGYPNLQGKEHSYQSSG